MSDLFKPLLAEDYEEKYPLSFPVLVSPKLDGIRCLVIDGKPMTRSLKHPIKNNIIRPALEHFKQYDCWPDGELIAGLPTGDNVLGRSQSGVMKAENPLADGWTYFVFDTCDPMHSKKPFSERYKIVKDGLIKAQQHPNHPMQNIVVVPHTLVHNDEQLWSFEEQYCNAGYEGMMVRSTDGIYKWGRATARERILLKFKRFFDAEARIKGTYEEMENQNEQTTNPLGRSQRSSHKANKVGKGRLGGYHCETYWAKGGPASGKFDLKNDSDPALLVKFDCGAAAGVTQEWREEAWNRKEEFDNGVLTFKYQFRLGVEAPSHPVAKIIRMEE